MTSSDRKEIAFLFLFTVIGSILWSYVLTMDEIKDLGVWLFGLGLIWTPFVVWTFMVPRSLPPTARPKLRREYRGTQLGNIIDDSPKFGDGKYGE